MYFAGSALLAYVPVRVNHRLDDCRRLPNADDHWAEAGAQK